MLNEWALRVTLPARDSHRWTRLVARLLTLAGLAASNREGRRKIQEGGVYLDDERVTDPSLEVAPGDVDGRLLRLGRRSWARIRAR